MFELGGFFLAASFLFATTATVLSIIGFFSNSEKKNNIVKKRIWESARRALLISTLFGVSSIFTLWNALLNHDYSLEFVRKVVNERMPTMYLISALWGGMDGSMLFWSVLVLVFTLPLTLRMSPYATNNSTKFKLEEKGGLLLGLSSSAMFFLSVTQILTNPFRPALSDEIGGLNPLLQNPSMLIHPPMLYSGFTSSVMCFAIALSGIIVGGFSNSMLALFRKCAMFTWVLLTGGIILGGHWAYVELGWGGFWAWDPVENASFLPWLIATALIHTLMVEGSSRKDNRGNYFKWSVGLGLGVYLMSVFGTFLTRSGIVQSVHAFADGEVGKVFLGYLILAVTTCIALLLRPLKSEKRNVIFFTREGFILIANYLFMALLIVILWGTIYPVISEFLKGQKEVVGPPYFNLVSSPLFLLLIFTMSYVYELGWRRKGKVSKGFFVPVILALGTTVFFYLKNSFSFGVGLGIFASVLLILAMIRELIRGVKSQRHLFGIISHFAMGILSLSIVCSVGLKKERDVIVGPGERATLGEYEFQFGEFEDGVGEGYQSTSAPVKVFKNGQLIAELSPERRNYGSEITSEVSIESSFTEDLYIAFLGMTPDEKQGVFRLYINPLQIWVWIGGVILVFGGIGATLSTTRKRAILELSDEEVLVRV